MPFKIILATAFLFYSVPALAGWQLVGNGGHVLVCNNSIFVLDYYESIHRYNLSPQIPKLPNPVEIAAKILQRMPHCYHQEMALALIKNMSFGSKSTEGLPLSQDFGKVYLPRECKLEQLVLQNPSRGGPGEPTYLINKAHWLKLPPEQQAVIMLHEAFYRMSEQARSLYSSESIRYLVALLISNEQTSDKFEQLLEDLNLMNTIPYGNHAICPSYYE